MAETIASGKWVELRYTMKTSGGKVLDDSGAEPQSYIHGHGAVVPGLERALTGKQAGEKFSIECKAGDAFGARGKSAGPQPVPRSTFPEDAPLKPGVKFTAESPDGAGVTLYITKIDEKVVHVDSNHPYAGLTLIFDVDVVSVRDATAAERRAMILSNVDK